MHSTTARLESLQARHKALSAKIEQEQTRPGGNDYLLRSLKQQKLHLKEQIEGMIH